ncbi:hypothetical protein [Alkaliphilus hydrothermalis]|uniref:Uncharacterized protein n=1 Tax=Alkaliphilus hydrothermalis TaxID=1482730 RepID=A0ABS2NQZ0_9FIRM|nr:hypothetical protein [Alkaliphilus hydrothermalis]MBM7615375.1 hypothetical protein [Alkaliphilus hydrothermalis]
MQNIEKQEIYSLFDTLIQQAVGFIYNYQIEKGLNLIINIMEYFNEIKPLVEQSPHVNHIEEIFNSILIASEKKDYILITDLLEFELRDLMLQLFETNRL